MSVEVNLKSITKKTVIGKTLIDGRMNSNAGAIALGDYIVAIDLSTTAESALIFRKAIEEHFNLPTKYLLVTHYHGDHTDGIRAFKDTIVVGSKALYKQMKSNKKPFPPELMFTNKLLIENSRSRVEFHYIAGHTVCSSIAYFPKEKVIFLGDLLFADSFPWAGDSSCNPDLWIAFFEKILNFDFDHVVPGHGPLCGKEETRKQLKLLKELRDNTLKAISEKTGPTRIKKPVIYELTNKSRVTRTMQFFYDFYSKRNEF